MDFFAHPENTLLGMLGDDDEDVWRMVVNKLCSLQLKRPSYPIDNDNFEGGFIDPGSVLTECTAIEKFLYQKSTSHYSLCYIA